jgi:hypothetical protein
MQLAKTKISTRDITYGPNTHSVDPMVAWIVAAELKAQGYQCVSNAYCCVGRIDRDDWLDVLALQRRCSRADFYNVDGSGIGPQHREHYIRVFTGDTHTVHPDIYRALKKYEATGY